MNLPALLAELSKHGITVEPTGTDDLYVTPRAAVTPDLRQGLRLNKIALLTYLRARTLAIEAERAGIDLVDYVAARAPELLEG